ncbi:HD family hydrolase [Fulvimarina sp. MAC3]|uniref:HD family hydrolase n=1 Tax=Fulvimarina sp. MAC3 TaxID=3148887 RepID=UPI0031FBCA24
MLSGRRLDLLDPSPLDIEIADIAHGLARVARWNGQTLGDHAFSVAQHSLVVEELVAANLSESRWRLAALLHDAPEYVIGDMISPFKAVLGINYKAVEARLQAAIHIRFGLPSKLPSAVEKQIKAADKVSAREEAVRLAGFSASEADMLFGRAKVGDAFEDRFVPSPAKEMEHAFLRRFQTIDQELHPDSSEPLTDPRRRAGASAS